MELSEILKPKTKDEIMEALSHLEPKEKLMQSSANGCLYGVKDALKDIRYFGDVSEALDIAAVKGRLAIVEAIGDKVIELGLNIDSAKIYLKWKRQIANKNQLNNNYVSDQILER